MEIKIYSEFPEELKKEWNHLLSKGVCQVPFLRYEYLLDWWQTRGGGEWPQDAELMILIAFEKDQVIGIAPFFRVEHEGKNKLILLGAINISDFLDLIVAPENLQEFVHYLLNYLHNQLIPKKRYRSC